MNLENQNLLVIGGSSGIGLAVAQQALAAGMHVTIAGRSLDRLKEAAAGLADASTLVLDIENAEAVSAAFDSIPTPDHVYLAAGRFVGGPVVQTPITELRGAFEARLWGSLHCVRALAPRMTGPRASFVLTGGVSTDRPARGAWITSVATAASEQLARVLALELAPLRVNAIAPGWTDTPMWDALLGSSKSEVFAATAQNLPVGRIATADEAAMAVLHLMANPSITGEVLHVDGGYRLAA